MKKISLLFWIIFILPAGISAQDFLWNVKTGAANRVTSEGSYIAIDFKPFFYFKKFYGALDLEFSFEPSGALKQDDWDNLRAISEKIVYLGYGKENEDPYFFRIGTLDDLTLGYGILVNHFRNDVYAPLRKKQGFSGGYDFGYTGLSAFCEDLFDLDFFGGRLFVRPLYWMDAAQIPPFIRLFQFGISFVTDLDPLDQESDGSGTYYLTKDNPNSKTVRAFALDLTIPIFESELFSIDNYMQYGDLQNIGAGLSYGFKGKFLSSLSYRMDISYNWDGFQPGYFSEFYNVRSVRASRFEETKNLENGWAYLMGMYGDFFNGQFKTGAEFSKNLSLDPSFLIYARLQPTLLKRLFIQFSFQRRDIGSFMEVFDIQNLDTSLIHLEIGYEMTANAAIAVRYIRNYSEEGGIVKSHSTTEIQTSLLF